VATTIDSTNNRILMTGDGFGYNRCKLALEAPPVGSNVCLYILRFWLDDGFLLDGSDNQTINTIDWNASWDMNMYTGVHFGGNIPTLASNNDRDPNLFGLEPYWRDSDNPGTGQLKWHWNRDGNYLHHSHFQSFSGIRGYTFLSDGQGGYVAYSGGDSSPSINTSKTAGWPITETAGQTYTAVWKVYSSAIDDAVYADVWINENSIDLDNLDLSTISLDNPSLVIPASYTAVSSVEINGTAETGTNWRPSTGVMAFPTHFVAGWPYSYDKMVVDYVATVYGQIT
jgi:hypothetical protein